MCHSRTPEDQTPGGWEGIRQGGGGAVDGGETGGWVMRETWNAYRSVTAYSLCCKYLLSSILQLNLS